MINRQSLKIGLIGLGKMGQNHLRILSMLKTVDLRFIYDVDFNKAKILSNKYDVKVSKNLEKDLANIDAVFIATSSSTHFDQINLVNKYVKNIFVEKPLTDDIAKSLIIKKLVEKKGINLQVGFIERFNPTVVELKNMLKNSSRVVNIDFNRTNKLSSRIIDINVIKDLMIHDIDIALFLNGAVEDVYSYGIRDDRGMVCYAVAILKHENGRFSKMTASRITEKRIRCITATCEDMYIECDLLKKEVVITKQTVNQSYNGVILSSVNEIIEVSSQEALLSEDSEFANSILSDNFGNSKASKVNDDINVMRVAEEVQKQI